MILSEKSMQRIKITEVKYQWYSPHTLIVFTLRGNELCQQKCFKLISWSGSVLMMYEVILSTHALRRLWLGNMIMTMWNHYSDAHGNHLTRILSAYFIADTLLNIAPLLMVPLRRALFHDPLSRIWWGFWFFFLPVWHIKAYCLIWPVNF